MEVFFGWFIWFILCVLVGILANKNNRSGILYFLISLILTPLVGLIIVLILGVPDKKSKTVSYNTTISDDGKIKQVSKTTKKLVLLKNNLTLNLSDIKEIIKRNYDGSFRAVVSIDNENLFSMRSTAGEFESNYIQIENKEDRYIIEAFNIEIPKELEVSGEKINSSNNIDKLIEISKMLEKGLITQEEFEEHKKNLKG